MMRTERIRERLTTKETCRVLIVDDMPQVRQDLRVLLELTGAIEIVGEAADGQQALELAEQLRPDVVIMDLLMPGVDGLTATRQIKERGLALRVIILTVYGDPETCRCVRDSRADALVLKGAPLETITDAILKD